MSRHPNKDKQLKFKVVVNKSGKQSILFGGQVFYHRYPVSGGLDKYQCRAFSSRFMQEHLNAASPTISATDGSPSLTVVPVASFAVAVAAAPLVAVESFFGILFLFILCCLCHCWVERKTFKKSYNVTGRGSSFVFYDVDAQCKSMPKRTFSFQQKNLT